MVPPAPRRRGAGGARGACGGRRLTETIISLTDGAHVDTEATDVGSLLARLGPPPWLRRTGTSAWFLVGIGVVLAALAWAAGQAEVIVVPVLLGLVMATVASPVVAWLGRHGIRRALGALIVVLALLALATLVFALVVGGIVAHSGETAAAAQAAAAKASAWLEDVGVGASGAAKATDAAKSTVHATLGSVVEGILAGVHGIASIALSLSFTVLTLFFLLRDGPALRAWIERRLRVEPPVATTITGGVIHSIRAYFTGVTLVAAFNGVIVFLGALVLDVPLAGTIGIVTFVTAYVPFIGAFVAGAFAVVLALGSNGTTTALIMLVIVILANGLLQNIVQPLAFGATLDLHPVIVLLVTIGSGALFGMVGLILAAPLVSAAVHVTRALAAPQSPP